MRITLLAQATLLCGRPMPSVAQSSETDLVSQVA